MMFHCNGTVNSLKHAPIEYDRKPCPLCAELWLRAESDEKNCIKIDKLLRRIAQIEDEIVTRRNHEEEEHRGR